MLNQSKYVHDSQLPSDDVQIERQTSQQSSSEGANHGDTGRCDYAGQVKRCQIQVI